MLATRAHPSGLLPACAVSSLIASHRGQQREDPGQSADRDDLQPRTRLVGNQNRSEQPWSRPQSCDHPSEYQAPRHERNEASAPGPVMHVSVRESAPMRDVQGRAGNTCSDRRADEFWI